MGRRAAREDKMAVLQVPGVDEALAAFARKCPKVVASAEPSFLGTPCAESDLRARYQAFGLLVGRDEALPLVEEEPLLLAMLEPNLKASWEALLYVAGGDRSEALRVLRRNPACLISDATQLRTKSLRDFEAAADGLDAIRPVTDALRDIGPEGVAVGAAAFGVAALGALASKVAADRARLDGDSESKLSRDGGATKM